MSKVHELLLQKGRERFIEAVIGSLNESLSLGEPKHFTVF